MKKALFVLVTLCVAMALSCASGGGGGTQLGEAGPIRPVLPGDITGNLGDYTTINQDTQKGWCSNETDNIATDLEADAFIRAKFLVLKLKSKPIGGLQLIWQGDGNSWAWAQTDGILSDSGVPNAARGVTLSADNVLRIDLSKSLKDYGLVAGCTKIKFYLGYYSDDIDSLGVYQADFEY
jgi:hypothetical protein